MPDVRTHSDRVLRSLRQSGPLTRGELGELCGLSRTTLYEVVSRLVDHGLVIATVPDAGPRGRGRPAERLALNPDAGRSLGIDFGRRIVRVAATAVPHDDIGTASEPCRPDAPWPERVALARRLADTLTGGRLRLDVFNGVGVSVTDPAAGSSAPVDRRALAALIGRSFGTRVRLDGAPRSAALAETVWGAAKGRRDVLYLELSDRVGGALVSAGALHHGAHGRSGEFGHITVEPAGAPCPCGGRGCLQTVASTTAVLNAYRATADLPDLAAALCAGEPAAHAAVRRAGTYAGRVLAGLANALGPGAVVVGGELVTAAPALMESVRRELRANVVRWGSQPPLLVRRAELGDFAAALGAVFLLRRPTDTSSSKSARSAFNPAPEY
ncbi:ROK family transcriptional regulator [Streptomyces sp. AC512_CC834]|uniref:ROK family transcriptional regulator n=1 Tax=Streptomyces sp. AC512_CC834 TaxID=2823691 RepID=UPI0027E569E9|nr:ROK family transcriptional regulator [Streptomyces sp. AC512_CC834]